jgi:hypothetical protein
MTKPNGCTIQRLKLIGKQQKAFCHHSRSNVEDVGQDCEATIGPRADSPRQVQINDKNQMDAPCKI